MSSAEARLAAMTRRERARVWANGLRLTDDLSTLGRRACRKHPIASFAVGALTAAAVAGFAFKLARRSGKSGRRGLIVSSLTGAVKTYLLHLVTASLEPRRDRRA